MSDVSSTFLLLATSGPTSSISIRPGFLPKASDSIDGGKNGNSGGVNYISEVSCASPSGGSEMMSEGNGESESERESRMSTDTSHNDLNKKATEELGLEMLSSSSSGSMFQKSSVQLPDLVVDDCNGATLYLLAPFASATITNCTNCEIIIGAVSRVVYLVGCEQVKLTCCSGKLVVRNCLDSFIFSASLSQTVICGDSRGTEAPLIFTLKLMFCFVFLFLSFSLCTF